MAAERQAKDSDTTNAINWLDKANRLYRRHYDVTYSESPLTDALNAYSRHLETEPDCLESFCGIARVHLLMGEYEKAEKTLARANKKLLQLTSNSSNQATRFQRDLHYLHGLLCQRRGDKKTAQHFYEQSAQCYLLPDLRFSGFSRLQHRLFETLWDQFFSTQTPSLRRVPLGFKMVLSYSLFSLSLPFERERQSIRKLAQVIPRALFAGYQHVIGLQDAAMTTLTNLHADYPGLPALGCVIGNAYAKIGETNLAGVWFDKSLERHPADIETIYSLGTLQERTRDYKAMTATYERLTRLQPSNPHVWCHLANAHYYQQSHTQALSAYQSAFHLGTDNTWRAMIAQCMGNIYQDYLGNPLAAMASFESAKALNPLELENYLQLGTLYFQNDDFVNSELVYQQALKRFPKSARLWSNLGFLRWMADDTEQAMHCYQTAIDYDPTYNIALNNLGVIHLDMLGQVDAAMQLFERAIGADPNYALAYYNMGRAHSFLGQRLEAATAFQTAQDLNAVSCELDRDDLSARIQNLFNTPEMEMLE